MNLYKKMNWKTIFFLGKWGYLLHFTRNLSERIKEVIIKLGFEVIKDVKQQKKKQNQLKADFQKCYKIMKLKRIERIENKRRKYWLKKFDL